MAKVGFGYSLNVQDVVTVSDSLLNTCSWGIIKAGCHTKLLALFLEDDTMIVDEADFVDEDHATAEPQMHKTVEDHVLETERRTLSS